MKLFQETARKTMNSSKSCLRVTFRKMQTTRGYGMNRNPLLLLACSERFERPNYGFADMCSIMELGNDLFRLVASFPHDLTPLSNAPIKLT
jgi:hypothetical protein